MNILHVLPRIDTISSGVAYSIPRLCGALGEIPQNNVELYLLSPSILPPSETRFRVTVFPSSRQPLLFRLGVSSKMKQALQKKCEQVEIIHNHSLWMAPNLYVGAASGKYSKLIVAPRGTLSEWALNHSKYRKKVLGLLGQNRVLARCDAFHATSRMEVEDIRRLGYRQPIILLPNGVDIPPQNSARAAGGQRKMVFISRLHPKKGLDILLEEWRKLEPLFPEWTLYIVGPDGDEYPRMLKKRAWEYRLERLIFTGEYSRPERDRLLSEADLFVLPTHSENFGMVVAEALACGVPVVCSQGAPWEKLEERHAGWWPPLSEFGAAMKTAMAKTRGELQSMGACGKAWMEEEFGWSNIGRKMQAAYAWLRNNDRRGLDWIIQD